MTLARAALALRVGTTLLALHHRAGIAVQAVLILAGIVVLLVHLIQVGNMVIVEALIGIGLIVVISVAAHTAYLAGKKVGERERKK